MSGRQPTTTGPPLAVCYRCGQPLKGVCVICGKFFCRLHGGLGMRLCWRHSLIIAAVALVVTMLLIAGTLIAVVLHILSK